MPENNTPPTPNANPEKYQDLEGLTLKKLEIGLWFIQKFPLMKKVFTLFLIIIAAASWSYTIFNLSYYMLKGVKDDNKMLAEAVATKTISHDTIVQISPKSLQVGSVNILNSTRGKYDFIIEVYNPNPKNWATFNYAFVMDGQVTQYSSGFILPGEKKYLYFLGYEADLKPLSAELQFSGLAWNRIDPRKIKDWSSYREERLRMQVVDKKFNNPKNMNGEEKVSLSTMEFTVANNSAYNYWNVDFLILLYSQGRLVGINKYGINEFRSGETRIGQSTFVDQFGRVDSIEILPDLNIMDAANYFKFTADYKK